LLTVISRSCISQKYSCSCFIPYGIFSSHFFCVQKNDTTSLCTSAIFFTPSQSNSLISFGGIGIPDRYDSTVSTARQLPARDHQRACDLPRRDTSGTYQRLDPGTHTERPRFEFRLYNHVHVRLHTRG
jgi:hypothetical protein